MAAFWTASRDGPPPVRRTLLPVVETEPPRPGPDRALDRRVTFAGLGAAALFLVAAAASLVLPAGVRLGWWLPLHLALAGGAATAIAAMVPFFVAALAVAPPAPAALHGGAIVLVASGAALAGVGRALDPSVPTALPTFGAALFVAGAAAVMVAALLPLRRAAGTRRPATEAAYVAGLGCVMAGVTLGGLYLAGLPEVVAAWPRLRVAHAWLNAFGFLPLVVAGTLLHFAPTVAGARIRPRRSGLVAVAMLGVGVIAGAMGYVLDLAALVQFGAALMVVGAGALTWHGGRAQRDAAGWSSDREWHRFTSWSLLAAPGWLLVAMVIATARSVAAGASGGGWRLDEVAGPLVVGFALQVLLGAMAHLVPAIGPAGPAERAAARRALGQLGSVRVVTWNAGTAALTVGVLAGLPILSGLGAIAIGIAAAGALLSLVAAVARR